MTLALASCTAKVSTVGGGAAAAVSVKILTTQLNGIAVGDVATIISSVGGTPPLNFALTAGALPDGLSLDAPTGMIFGKIPISAANASYTFTLKLNDATGASATQTFQGTVSPGANALRIANTTLAAFVSPLNYNYSVVALGGSNPYVYTVSAGSLPAGLSLIPTTGLITGTITAGAAGSPYAFDLTVTDGTGLTATKSFSGTVATGSTANFSIATGSIPTPIPGQTYATGIAVSGGTAPITYAITSGSAPCGLSLNTTTGVLSGTATFASRGSAYSFTVRAQDAAVNQTFMTYSGTCGTYTTSISPSSISTGTPGTSYSALFVTTGGLSPYTYAVTAGSLPSGLSLDTSSGILSGIVNQSEAGLTKSFTITSTDTSGITSSQSYSISTTAFVVSTTTTTLANAQEGMAYDNAATALAATGGSAPYTFEYTGTLPGGIGLTSTGSFFGTPSSGSGNTSGITYSIAVRARDSLNQVSGWVNLSFSVTVTTPLLGANTLPNAILGAQYSASLAATGGRAPYTYAVTAGTLPSGISLSGNSFTGSTTLSYTCPANQFTVAATDALGQTSPGVVKCIATVSGVGLTTNALPVIVPAVNYSASVTASGGSSPHTFSASGLPSGISLNSTTGALSGFTNSGVGDYQVYITATDSSTPPQSATRQYTMSIRAPLVFSGGALPAAATGTVYNSTGYQLNATGGQSPYSFVITNGALPSGLSMASNGLITGTPASTTANYGGSYSIDVVATDYLGSSSAAQTFTLTVSIPPTLPESVLPIAKLNQPYAHDIKRVGGTNSFNGTAIATRLSWSASGLPSGLSMGTTTGRISGTPTTNAASPYTVAVTVTDQHGFTSTKNMTLNVVSTGKTLRLDAARNSDPCTGGIMGNCGAHIYDIGKITGNSQQYYIYPRNDLTPVRIQIAKIDSKGRVPLASSKNTSVNFQLPSNVNAVWHIRMADIDRDNNMDIAFTDSSGRKFCVAYNAGTTDTFGMPTGFTAANTFCWPIPTQVSSNTNAGAAQFNKPYAFTIRNDLRTSSSDANFSGPPDVIINSTNPSNNNAAIPATVIILKNLCATAQAPCADSSTYTLSATTTAAVSTVTLSSGNTTGLKVGFPVIGTNLFAGTKITSIVNSTSFTVSPAPSASGATTLVSSQRPMMFDGFAAVPATINSTTAVTLTQANLNVGSGNPGPIFSGVGLPNLTTSLQGLAATGSAAGSITLSTAATATGSTLITYPQQQSFTGTSAAASNVITTTNTSGIYIGQMVLATGCAISDRLFVTGITANTSVTTNINVGATCVGATFYAYGPASHTAYLLNASNAGVSASITVDVGWFSAAKPATPSLLTGANQCPAIVMSGFQNNATANGWLYIMRQTWTGSACSGDFVTHTTSDEQKLWTNTPWVDGLLAADFNNDGLTDLAVSSGAVQTNSASVMYWTSPGGATLFSTPNTSLTKTISLQTRTTPTTVTVSASKLQTYCLDGTSSCQYPALVAFCGRDGLFGTSSNSCVSLITNQCAASGCASPFETSTNPAQRVDYPTHNGIYRNPVIAPIVSTSTLTPTGTTTLGSATITSMSSTAGIQAGQEISGTNIPADSFVTGVTATTITLSQAATGSGPVTLSLPAIPTLNDIAFGAVGGTGLNLPVLTVIANNGGVATHPLRASTALETNADMGTMKFTDLNGDSQLDLIAFAPVGGMLNSYVSSSGSPPKNLGGTAGPYYLSDPAADGCPATATLCYPAPVLNWMGVQQALPMGTDTPTQVTMDTADINNDGIADALVNGYSSRGIAVSQGSATGDFTVPVLYDFGNGTDLRPVSAIFADLDQDGIMDMAAIGRNMTGTQTGFAAWFKGNGDGTFQNSARIDQIVNNCTDPRTIAAVDLDLDGRPELAVLCYTSQQIWVSRRHSNGTWITNISTNVNSGGGNFGTVMKWGRLTSGGPSGVDLVVGGRDAASTMRVIAGVSLNVTNTSTGAFSLSSTTIGNYMSLYAFPSDVEIADLNGDGYGDFAAVMPTGTSGNNLGAFMYTCSSTAASQCTIETWGGNDGVAASNIIAGDLTSDGLPEIFVSYQYSATSSLIYKSISRVNNSSY